ncbi:MULTISPECIES: deaminase [unclassified Streptomyces]|uniref:deaminase n=1 Tax=unclassified Streptomyces TaxID=2593676 RepID=UPI000AC80E11|nr:MULTISPECIES: deaminase [unclassified Streptomyces]
MTHADDVTWMKRAIELSRKCPPAEGAFSVGAIIVSADGDELAHGYSRETDALVHAEESALAKLPADDPRLTDATLYSTLEPCSERKSRPLTCTQLILRSPIRRVVIAWREPSLLVADCIGVEALRDGGAEVLELPELAEAARAVNVHLPI